MSDRIFRKVVYIGGEKNGDGVPSGRFTTGKVYETERLITNTMDIDYCYIKKSDLGIYAHSCSEYFTSLDGYREMKINEVLNERNCCL